MPKKNKNEFVTYNDFKKLEEKVDDLKELIVLQEEKYQKIKKTINSKIEKLDKKIEISNKRIGTQIDQVDKKIDRTNEQIEDQIKTQEEIIMDMIHKFNEEFLKNKNALMAKIDDIKSQQDVLKISYSVNEKKLLEKVKGLIHNEMKKLVRDNEKEVLMDIWIKELKNIVNDVEKMKKLDPKEFEVQINEIANTIKLFKQKLE